MGTEPHGRRRRYDDGRNYPIRQQTGQESQVSGHPFSPHKTATPKDLQKPSPSCLFDDLRKSLTKQPFSDQKRGHFTRKKALFQKVRLILRG